MSIFNDDSNFSLFRSISYQIEDKDEKGNDLDNNYLLKSANPKLTQYQNEISKYDRKISMPDGTYSYRGNENYHFEFIGHLNLSPEKKQISEKKRKINNIDINNISIFRRKIESNSLYVGFENKYGENSCYINVVLHFLYFFPCINEFLIKLYITKKDSINLSNNNITNVNNYDFFLFLLGKTLFEYQNVLSNSENKGITILHTTELRKYLDIISNNIYQFNKVADPVELLTFLINSINKNNENEVHKYFFINLIEEIQCNGLCQKKEIKKYDKDNFIFHIYVDEIMNYINQNNLQFQNYNKNLFKLSQLISLNYFKNCEKCGNKVKKLLKLSGKDYPIFLLINCIWNNPRQPLKDVIKFFYILPLEDSLDHLFFSANFNYKQKIIYNLLGMILYSPGLSHYISVIFNIQKNIFVLYNDDKVKEFDSIHEVYKEITIEQIKKNLNAFYYPVLLIYYKEIIYDDINTLKKNIYSFKNYNYLIEESKKIKKQNEIILTDEQKKKNYLEYVKAQMKYEQNKHNNYFNDNAYDNNDNLGCARLYNVNEEIDDEKDNKSNKSFKMIIEEETKDNKDKDKDNNINNSNIININNNSNNKETLELNNNMNLEKKDNNNNMMNLENKEYNNNKNYNNIYGHNDNNDFGFKNYPSTHTIINLKNDKNNNDLIFQSFEDNDHFKVRRKDRRNKTDTKTRDFFYNII